MAHFIEQRSGVGDQAALAVEVDEGGPDADVVDQCRPVSDASVDAGAHLERLEGGAGLEDKGEGGGAGEEAQRLHLSVGGDDGDVVSSVGVELDEGVPLLLLLLLHGFIGQQLPPPPLPLLLEEWVITNTDW